MRTIQRILVTMPPFSDCPALLRGQQLALKLGAALDLLVFDPHSDQSEFIERQVTSLRHFGVRARGEQAGEDSSHAVLTASRAQESDLVIKQHFSIPRLKQLFTASDDAHLIRQLPVPLLLVRNSAPWEGGTVLAAMDVEHHDEEHVALQGNVMDYAASLCELLGASLHVVCAYSPALMPQGGPDVTIDEVVAAHLHEQCQWFQNEYELPEHRLHIGEGPAKALIPRIAHQLEAVVTVLGTVARHGLMGALLGNTAEHVLDHLDGDVLVLKPHTEPEPTGHRVA
ncbi:universal stress protein [Pseudomonas akapageensis]|uniref:universal stress protein n=1 Tax=Pseudomonas akapageensis TaxID=2609961 RepID=UPI00140AD76C|nr:universal stress protein [Pseudomonas akapageensis]